MATFHISTLGCQMNQADSLKLSAGLQELGYKDAISEDKADLFVINTCSVRQHAEDRAYSKLGILRKKREHGEKFHIVVMGCMVGANTKDLRRRFPYVDLWARPQEFEPILDLAVMERDVSLGELGAFDMAKTYAKPDGPTAYVPVIHGCDKFCTYCIVPLRRGREESRLPSDILDEINFLADNGVKEVTLLGQTVEAYGHDLKEETNLADLFEAIEDIHGIARTRFLTSYPKDMTDRIIDAVADCSKVCEHFNIPVQSGSNAMLERMRRGYRIEEFEERVAKIRERMPSASIATDIIVGCPGETESEFEETLDLLERTQFDVIHVASYSPRPGTFAYRKLDDDVPKDLKKSRLHLIEEIHASSAEKTKSAELGKIVEILVEKKTDDQLTGRTRKGQLVHFNSNASIGDLVDVKINEVTSWSMRGTQVGVFDLPILSI
tara:strand:+ start:6521 stop:7834 length:1314 start_codon:yes stop_codon:yes gene_type:complete